MRLYALCLERVACRPFKAESQLSHSNEKSPKCKKCTTDARQKMHDICESSLLNENDARVRFNVDVKSMNIEFIDRDGRCFQGLKLACQKRVAFLIYDSLPRWFIVVHRSCASSFCSGKDCHLKSQLSSDPDFQFPSNQATISDHGVACLRL